MQITPGNATLGVHFSPKNRLNFGSYLSANASRSKPLAHLSPGEPSTIHLANVEFEVRLAPRSEGSDPIHLLSPSSRV